MQNYLVQLHPQVEKDLRSIPLEISTRILLRISELPENPFPTGVKKLQGLGNTYRIRVGDYRIVYFVNTKERLIYVEYVSHRKDAYD
jgi:mRNA interferase RelE/StbE